MYKLPSRTGAQKDYGFQMFNEDYNYIQHIQNKHFVVLGIVSFKKSKRGHIDIFVRDNYVTTLFDSDSAPMKEMKVNAVFRTIKAVMG